MVGLEASSGTFCWADRIEARGARCVVVDPYRFRIIRDSWNKTDRRDTVNLSLGLWMARTRRECRLQEVYKPSVTVRQLFGKWQIVNKQVRQLKSQIQGVLDLSAVSRFCIQLSLKLLIGIRGITPLLALAFLADVGPVHRFTSLRRLNAYLGVVPKVHSPLGGLLAGARQMVRRLGRAQGEGTGQDRSVAQSVRDHAPDAAE